MLMMGISSPACQHSRRIVSIFTTVFWVASILPDCTTCLFKTCLTIKHSAVQADDMMWVRLLCSTTAVQHWQIENDTYTYTGVFFQTNESLMTQGHRYQWAAA